MSSILKKEKKKKVEADRSVFVFNFQSINIHVFSLVLLIVSLFIGYIYCDDKYYQFNQLPDDRNELMPIKSMNLSVDSKCVLKVEIEIKSIIKQTFLNLFKNINVQVIENGQSQSEKFIISTQFSDSVQSSDKYFCFSKKLNNFHNFTAQIHLFAEPISKKYEFSCQ